MMRHAHKLLPAVRYLSVLALAGVIAPAALPQTISVDLGTGQGLWRIKNRSFVVQHQLHPAELAMYETGQKARGA